MPQAYLASIDRATTWRWKQEAEDKYLGTELTSIELLERFVSRKESETIIRAYLKIANALSRILTASGQLHRILKKHKKTFIQLLPRYKARINVKLVLWLCRIPVSVFHYWKHRS
jgi:hypothetical protein